MCTGASWGEGLPAVHRGQHRCPQANSMHEASSEPGAPGSAPLKAVVRLSQGPGLALPVVGGLGVGPPGSEDLAGAATFYSSIWETLGGFRVSCYIVHFAVSLLGVCLK